MEDGIEGGFESPPDFGIKNATARPPARINRPSLRGVFMDWAVLFRGEE
jgi:hypothetical protein